MKTIRNLILHCCSLDFYIGFCCYLTISKDYLVWNLWLASGCGIPRVCRLHVMDKSPDFQSGGHVSAVLLVFNPRRCYEIHCNDFMTTLSQNGPDIYEL